MDPHISIQVVDPNAPVNPFASTASPNSLVNPFATTKKPVIAQKPSEPPPVLPPTPVSPLATSASISDRGAYDEIMAGVEAETKAREQKKQKAAGTQMMTNAPARAATPTPAPAPVPAKKPVARTVAMGNWNTPKKPASAPAQSVAAPSAPLPAPSAPKIPASVAAPSAVASSGAVASSAAASSGHGQPSYPQAPAGPGGWGWNPPPRPVVPGARVTVTWSNGQRYPATVNQINGSRCLVVFPDGQQHWVESQFVSAT